LQLSPNRLKFYMRRSIASYDGMHVLVRWFLFLLIFSLCSYFAISWHSQIYNKQKQLLSRKENLLAVKKKNNNIKSTLGNRVYADQLMRPQQMLSLLQSLMRGVSVRLISFKSLKSKPYESLYLQPADIVVEGNYRGVVTYLRRLENSRYRILWQKIHLNLVGDSVIRADIHLQTVSDLSAWIKLSGKK
jgi:hypothetical protein